MPPSAILSRVKVTIPTASVSPAAMRRSRYSSVIGWGNLGAPPHDPLRASNEAVSAASTAPKNPRSMAGPDPGVAVRFCSTSALTSRCPAAIASPRSMAHACATPSSTWVKDGIPWRGRSGKYVPP